jgi:Trk K+ transport system NAD-binding subunit
MAQLYETIRNFAERVPNAFVLIEGIDYLIMHNNFAKILHFIRQVKGMMAKSDDCLIVPKGLLALEPKQERLLEAEFLVLPRAAAEAEEKARRAEEGRKNYIIIGHNPLAQSIISEFEKKGIRPAVIEKREVLVHYPKGAVKIIKGDPLSSKVLLHAGICRPNTIVLITLEDDSDIILCINKIRQLSDSAKIITNIHDQQFMTIAMKAGADSVIPSSAIGGRLISLALTSPDIVRWVMDATTLAAKEIELLEVMASAKTGAAGKTIGEVDTLLGRAANIIAVKTVEGLQQIPRDEYALKEGDRLVLVANMEALPRGKTMGERVARLVRKRR